MYRNSADFSVEEDFFPLSHIHYGSKDELEFHGFITAFHIEAIMKRMNSEVKFDDSILFAIQFDVHISLKQLEHIFRLMQLWASFRIHKELMAFRLLCILIAQNKTVGFQGEPSDSFGNLLRQSSLMC